MYTTHVGALFNFPASVYCGFFVDEQVMRKLHAEECRHREAVAKIMADNLGHVHESSWTLYYPGGKQTSIHYYNPDADLRERLQVFQNKEFWPKPHHLGGPDEPVFIARGYDEAKEAAIERWMALNPGEPRPNKFHKEDDE